MFKNSSRALAIKEAILNKFDCVVLDDGFQDSSINKNLNIICFNEKQLIKMSNNASKCFKDNFDLTSQKNSLNKTHHQMLAIYEYQ